MKSQNFKAFALTGFSIALAAGLSGCGKSDPRSDYPSLQGLVPPNPGAVVQKTQIPVDTVLFKLHISNGASEVSVLNFVQGQTTTYLIKPELLVDGVQFTLSATGLPDGATFAPATEPQNAGSYKLTWAPALGTLASRESFRLIPLQILIHVVSSPNQQSSDLMQTIGASHELDINLVQTHDQPLIESIVLDTPEIQVGASTGFTVTVEDDGASPKQLPSLLLKPEPNQGQTTDLTPVLQYVSLTQTPTSLGNGKYAFKGTFNSTGAVLPDGTGPVSARFDVVVEGATQLTSPAAMVEVRIDRPAPAVPAPAGAVNQPAKGANP